VMPGMKRASCSRQQQQHKHDVMQEDS
jgi:hypothetical protein